MAGKEYTRPMAKRYFGCEFTADEALAVEQAIAEEIGEDASCVQDMVFNAMEDFGKEYGIHRSEVYLDDAIVFLCMELGIDHKQFPHNTPKRPIDGFIREARRLCPTFKQARNETQRKLQRVKLHRLFVGWINDECEKTGCGREWHGPCSDKYAKPDLDAIADMIAAENARRPVPAALRLVVNNA